ncbi:hypothetical protein MKX57_15660 [Lysinibacillus sp. FSL M8-0216]|uniref:Uncharacterized protein n=1 Tax=Lysinibacillus fusiformis TaxID=28031 RepID=A0A1H9IIM2_9BACI|nr:MULTISPECIES: hypothetical protein [Lysinibacillus]EAZ85060.1 hypothetical protein BB14905_22358 [Bacillus sp. B14905]MCG7437687.1 hypothetical protein [Lysinibacillus fusiformis]MED4078134.1 hypothetical protein [Lysinibacillus fusiformis]MED4670402.1 hypothetical protein [Lysinibacillus fusiformis]NOG28770.1 hypothetical protein [Lysinibacillus fusiformis]
MAQEVANKFIENVCNHLVRNMNITKVEEHFKETIAMQRNSATSAVDFWDMLMINMLYFTENEQAWEQEFLNMLNAKKWVKPSTLEEELLMHQMRIRQQVAEQMDTVKELFHQQYETEGMTEEAIIYDYAYSSAGHSMRMDLLTVLVSTPEQSQILFDADPLETIRVVNGYIAYHTDGLINKTKLL